MKNKNAEQKGYQITASKHISEVVLGDMLMVQNAVIVATSDAYMEKTGNGKEWSFECGEEYFYASEFEDGLVDVVTLETGEGYKLDVDYASVWDGGTLITTTAKVDIRTGEVTDIKHSDVEGLNNCEREYIVMNDVEVNVYSNERGFDYWADLKNEYM